MARKLIFKSTNLSTTSAHFLSSLSSATELAVDMILVVLVAIVLLLLLLLMLMLDPPRLSKTAKPINWMEMITPTAHAIDQKMQ